MRRLETHGDGWRFAVDVLRKLRQHGPEKCRANLPPPYVHQADALIKALAELKERGTMEACASFGAVLTDAIGTRALEPVPELYEGMMRRGQARPYKLRRLLGAGHWIAALAVARQAEGADNGGKERGTDARQGRADPLTSAGEAPPDKGRIAAET